MPNQTTSSVFPALSSFRFDDESTEKNSFLSIYNAANHFHQLGRQIVAIQGMGFVGIGVAAVIANALDDLGQPLYFVIGVDIPGKATDEKIQKIENGLSPLIVSDPKLMQYIHTATFEHHNLCITGNDQVYAFADVIVVDIPLDVGNLAVQTPADITLKQKSFVSAISTIGRHMRAETLVLVETTVPIGASEHIILPLLKEALKKRGIDTPPYLAYSYERVMPGPNYIDSIREYWRSFAGIDKASSNKAKSFLSTFTNTDSYPLCEVDSTTDCELGKLLENSYRAVNIAFIFEWTLMAEKIGVNLFTVIDSIKLRKGTHDNIRLPGFGVGGYCLPKDSLLAQWAITNIFDSNLTLEMTLKALAVNRKMPLHVFELISSLTGNNLLGKTVAVCGVSYLPEVADTRNSPTEILIKALVKAGALVKAHDPFVFKWAEMAEIALSMDLATSLKQAQIIVFAVPHRSYKEVSLETILGNSTARPLIVDAQNIITDEKATLLYEQGCRLVGVGKGHWQKKGYHIERTND